MPYCLRSKILSMAHLTCSMVVVPKLCVSVYDKPVVRRTCHRAECDVLLLSMVTQGGKTPYMPTDELEHMGYDIIIFASDVQRAAILGMRRLLQELCAQRTGELCALTAGFQKREGIINSDHYFQLQERYLCLN